MYHKGRGIAWRKKWRTVSLSGGREAGRPVQTPLGVKNAPPAVPTFGLTECRPQGQPTPVERQCCRYLLSPGFLLLYNLPPCFFFFFLYHALYYIKTSRHTGSKFGFRACIQGVAFVPPHKAKKGETPTHLPLPLPLSLSPSLSLSLSFSLILPPPPFFIFPAGLFTLSPLTFWHLFSSQNR